MSAAPHQTWPIHGGIHPAENKHQSTGSPICFAGIAPELVLPLSQHIGAPASPIVAIGERVLKGQMIAEAKGPVSVPIHAPSSGTLIAIEERPLPHASGMSGRCMVIATDGLEEWSERDTPPDYHSLDAGTLVQRIRDAGIAGMGGAGFPTAVKLSPRTGTAIDTLIINGTECEPYITADDMLMRERADQIIAGTQILQHIIRPGAQTLIGVEDNKPEAIAALQKAAQGTGIQIVVFPTKYPSGGEKQLIQILTGREVPSGRLPADIGVVCQNVGTAAAIYRAIALGEPLISRVTTVTGDACLQQRNFDTLLGTPVQFLLDQCGYDPKRCQRLVMGGPMMGFTLGDVSVPVVKTSNCILAASAEESPPPVPAQACIRCGLCAEACPVSLLPQQMYWFARGREYEKLEAHNLMDCIECGACSYVCPSHIPLVQYYRASKAEIRQQQLDHKKAEQSKARFEARKERIERLEAEKAAKRAARQNAAKAKASEGDSKTDLIQAAIERAKAKKAAVDPAQAAIDKAKARRSGTGQPDAVDRASLETAVNSAEKRLASAQEKLAQARAENSGQIAAFETAVDKMQAKLKQAQSALDSFSAPPSPSAETGAQHPAETGNDAAQQAIERAKAKRAELGNMSEDEKQQQKIAALKDRIGKARQKLAAAEAEGAETVDILNSSLAKLEEKLAAAEAEQTEQG